MRKTLAVISMIFCTQAYATGFVQSNYAISESYTVATQKSSAVSIAYQLPSSPPGAEQFYMKSDVISANEDPSQLVRLYSDSSLTQPLYGQVIDLKPYADGSAHTLTIYAKFYSSSSNAISKAGYFTFTAPLYIMDGTTETSSNLNMAVHSIATCGFLQSVYNVNKTASSNSTAEQVVTVAYNCSNGLSPTMSSPGTSFISGEDSEVSMSIFSDASATQNIGSTPVALTANGSDQNQNLLVKFFDKGNAIIKKNGVYHITAPIIINY